MPRWGEKFGDTITLLPLKIAKKNERLRIKCCVPRLKERASERRPLILLYLAGGRGFEPRFTESESVVLPLNDPPVHDYI